MTTLKRLTLTDCLIGLNALLAKSDQFYLVTFFGYDDMALSRVTRSALGLIEATNARSF
jgi:hypothetical protein